jgi:hypothetical protein
MQSCSSLNATVGWKFEGMPGRTQIGRRIIHVLAIATLGVSLNLALWAQAKPSIPPHGKLLALFNGKNFTGFDTLLEKQGINRDPNKVFQVERGVLHISGQEFGGLVTQKEYENYYLRAEFKWGEKTYPPRDGKARDSGIQYNITGPLKVWPRMMEFQINEGGTGDMWAARARPWTERYTKVRHPALAHIFESRILAGAPWSMSPDTAIR